MVTWCLYEQEPALYTHSVMVSRLSPKPFRRYRPYRRTSTLHSVFPKEKAVGALAHSAHVVFPMETNPAALEPPLPLLSDISRPDAATFFSVEAAKHSNGGKKIPKPPGEVGRSSERGYNLQVALAWSVEVYKEVQVTCSSSFYRSVTLTCIRSSQRSTSSLGKTYL